MKNVLATIVVLAMAHVAGPSQINPAQAAQLPNWIDPAPNNQNLGQVPSGPDVTIALQPGQQAAVLGLRSESCGNPAPEFPILMSYRVRAGFDIPATAKRHTEIYNAGVGRYRSVTCYDRVVPARVIGVRIKRGYNGPSEFTLTPFPGSGPRVHVHVKH